MVKAHYMKNAQNALLAGYNISVQITIAISKWKLYDFQLVSNLTSHKYRLVLQFGSVSPQDRCFLTET